VRVGPTVNPRQVGEQAKRDVLRESQARADLRAVLGTPAGRRYIVRLVEERCLLRQKIWTASAEIHLLEGRRQVGIDVMNEAARWAPDLYLEMGLERIRAEAEELNLREAMQREERTDG
jgi:hypothetical protein